MKLNRFRHILACPVCRGQLIDWNEALRCPACALDFPIERGVPIIFHPESSLIKKDGADYFSPSEGEKSRNGKVFSFRDKIIRKFLNVPVYNNSIKSSRQEWEENALRKCGIEEIESDGIILNLGSGVQVVDRRENFLQLDIASHFFVDVVGDGHFLPFQDGVFSGVCLLSVLEHVTRPVRIVEEINRVLKPGGFIFAYAPFCFPYHAAPHDYYRFTGNGLEQLFFDFDLIECYTDRCPTRALIIAVAEYASIFSDHRILSALLRTVTAWILNPLKYIDWYLSRKTKSKNIVTGFTYLGRKK